ncbi:hypothetical protein F5Y15DRAFT_81643 [Xylariaceae sp. FL0016]|nr:hypothetical protein F5Y15DRAFT_81643 [Xylariaceae sp. FL0016]
MPWAILFLLFSTCGRTFAIVPAFSTLGVDGAVHDGLIQAAPSFHCTVTRPQPPRALHLSHTSGHQIDLVS